MLARAHSSHKIYAYFTDLCRRVEQRGDGLQEDIGHGVEQRLEVGVFGKLGRVAGQVAPAGDLIEGKLQRAFEAKCLGGPVDLGEGGGVAIGGKYVGQSGTLFGGARVKKWTTSAEIFPSQISVPRCSRPLSA